MSAGRRLPPAAQATPGQAPATGGVAGERRVRGIPRRRQGMAGAHPVTVVADGPIRHWRHRHHEARDEAEKSGGALYPSGGSPGGRRRGGGALVRRSKVDADGEHGGHGEGRRARGGVRGCLRGARERGGSNRGERKSRGGLNGRGRGAPWAASTDALG